MQLKQLFRDELAYLKLQGKEFSQQNPSLSRFLSEKSTDPDVERLLEGFAFLSARLRQKIEDDFPELTHSMLNLLWPNYLRPVPSTTIIQFSPVDKGAITKKQILPRHLPLLSQPVDSTHCQFRSCHEVPIYPLQLNAIDCTDSRENSIIGLDFKTLSNLPFNEIGCDHLPVFISEDDYTAQTLYLWIFQYLDQIKIITCDDNTTILPASAIKPIGFSTQEALLPYPNNVFDGYRILQEYLSNPERFYFFDITGLESVWPTSAVEEIRIELYFNRPLPEDIKIRNSSFTLYCTPAINLFNHDADPVRLTGKSTEYPIKPTGQNPSHYEIFNVNQINGWTNKKNKKNKNARIYKEFESFEHEETSLQKQPTFYFQDHIQSSVLDDCFDHTIRFIRDDEILFDPEEEETISIELTCTNRNLPCALAIGDINIPASETPTFVSFKNITRPTEPLRPLLSESLHWQLISNMSINYQTLLKPKPLKNMIQSYDFRAAINQHSRRHSQQRLKGIQNIETKPMDHFIGGLPIRGIKSDLYLNPEFYACEGEMFLFGTVLSHFFSLFSSINSFHKLNVINTFSKEIYTWPLQFNSQRHI